LNHEIHEIHEKILYKDESFQVQGSIFSVYQTLGAGFLEAVYQECLEIEFLKRGIPFCPQYDIKLKYKGHQLRQCYKADFVCFEKIIVEIKAISEITAIHQAQVMNYLKATGLRLGILVNFCAFPRAEIERIVL
jgi:GxxExxY protein